MLATPTASSSSPWSFSILQRCTHIPSCSNVRHPHIHTNGHNFSTSMGWKDAESGLGPLFQAWRSSKGDRDRMIQNKHRRAVPAAELTRPHGVGPHQTLGVSQHVRGTQPWILVTIRVEGLSSVNACSSFIHSHTAHSVWSLGLNSRGIVIKADAFLKYSVLPWNEFWNRKEHWVQKLAKSE